jgi:rubrerythrin
MTTSVMHNREAAVQAAMSLLATRRAQRWVCEVCGMLHTGIAPEVCGSCGVGDALVQQAELHREMNSRW